MAKAPKEVMRGMEAVQEAIKETIMDLTEKTKRELNSKNVESLTQSILCLAQSWVLLRDE